MFILILIGLIIVLLYFVIELIIILNRIENKINRLPQITEKENK